MRSPPVGWPALPAVRTEPVTMSMWSPSTTTCAARSCCSLARLFDYASGVVGWMEEGWMGRVVGSAAGRIGFLCAHTIAGLHGPRERPHMELVSRWTMRAPLGERLLSMEGNARLKLEMDCVQHYRFL